MTTTPTDPRLPLTGRLAIAGLGALALALGGTGLAYASGFDDDSAWVVVEDDPAGSATDCPWQQRTDGDGL